MKMWIGSGNTSTLLFFLKELEILHREGRGQVKTIVMKHLNGILYHKSWPIRQSTILGEASFSNTLGQNIRFTPVPCFQTPLGPP